MKYAVIYHSNTGNTKLLAQAIGCALQEDTCVYNGGVPKETIEADIIFIGSWTDKGTCSDEVSAYLKTLHHQCIALFGTAGFGGSSAYFEQILMNVKQWVNDDCKVIDTFMCQGKMPMGIRKRYEMLHEQQPADERIHQFLQNFDVALAHPNEQDIQAVNEFAKKVAMSYHKE